jgi:hypothetical protein
MVSLGVMVMIFVMELVHMGLMMPTLQVGMSQNKGCRRTQ